MYKFNFYVSCMFHNLNIISSYTLNNLQIHKGEYDEKESMPCFYKICLIK
jgi:hypothetical protein